MGGKVGVALLEDEGVVVAGLYLLKAVAAGEGRPLGSNVVGDDAVAAVLNLFVLLHCQAEQVASEPQTAVGWLGEDTAQEHVQGLLTAIIGVCQLFQREGVVVEGAGFQLLVHSLFDREEVHEGHNIIPHGGGNGGAGILPVPAVGLSRWGDTILCIVFFLQRGHLFKVLLGELIHNVEGGGFLCQEKGKKSGGEESGADSGGKYLPG